MIPLYKPYMPELPELERILKSGHLASGKYTEQFEEQLKDYFDVKYLLVTNSFHMAIAVALTAAGVGYGDEVIASPMACLASTQAFASCGLKIVWADVDPYTGTLNPEDVRKRITVKTKIIVHNHFCGFPGYIDEINTLGKEFGLMVIDDGIECFGSKYKDRKIGNCGTDFTVFSFNPVRIPNTIDGGAVIFQSEEVYRKALLIRDCGIDRGIFRDSMGEINPDCDIEMMGYSATLSDVHSYIGCQQMEHIDEILEKQRNNAKRWDELIADHLNCTAITVSGHSPNYWVYGLLVKNKCEGILKFRGKGYYASGVHLNNNMYSIFGKYVPLPGVDEFYNHFIALPSGWWCSI